MGQCWVQVVQNTQSGILGLELAYPEARFCLNLVLSSVRLEKTTADDPKSCMMPAPTPGLMWSFPSLSLRPVLTSVVATVL